MSKDSLCLRIAIAPSNFPGENELQLTRGVTPRQVNQKEWMGLPQFQKEKALFIRKK